MITFLKIIGPPIGEAIKALEKLSINNPKVCIMDSFIVRDVPRSAAKGLPGTRLDVYKSFSAQRANFALRYFQASNIVVDQERCESIISDSGVELGEYDFYFEWFKEPSNEELGEVLNKVDQIFFDLGCRYTVYHKK